VSKYTPGERTSCDTTTRSVPLMMNVPLSVITGKSPMKTVWDLIVPSSLLRNSAVTNSGARVGVVLLLALLDGVLRVLEAVVQEGLRAILPLAVLDRGDLVEDVGRDLRR
jgi:hypothetical protein